LHPHAINAKDCNFVFSGYVVQNVEERVKISRLKNKEYLQISLFLNLSTNTFKFASVAHRYLNSLHLCK